MDFKKQVDEVLNGSFPKENMLFVCRTPNILIDIGLDDLPIMMTQKHLKTIINKKGEYKYVNYHDLGKRLIKKIPASLEKPLKVLDSLTKEDSIVVVTELVDKEGRPIIVAIKKNGKARSENEIIKSNILTSTYGRSNFNKFIEESMKFDKLLYDQEKGIIKRSEGKLQLRPITPNANIVSNNDINVNNYNMSNNENYVVKEALINYGYYLIEII